MKKVPPTPQAANRMHRQAISRAVEEASAAADAELAARLGLDIKGSPNDPFKARIEKAIPGRVKLGIAVDGRRTETFVSNKDREPGK